jgi:hypothetical protein
MYEKNDMRKYIKNKNVNDVMNDFYSKRDMKKANSPLLNSSAYSDCMDSLCSTRMESIISRSDKDKDRDDHHRLSFRQFVNFKNTQSVKDKVQNFTRSLDISKQIRMDKVAKKRNLNVNVMNYRYKDVNSNNYVVNLLPRFKRICDYNKKAQEFYNNDIYPNENYLKGGNKVNVFDRVLLYKGYFKMHDHDRQSIGK